MTSQTWQLRRGRTRLREKVARFPLQLMSLWVSNGGSACRRGEMGRGGRKPSSPKVPRVWIRHASWTQMCQWRNTREGGKNSDKKPQHITLSVPVRTEGKWRIMENTWGGEPQRHRMAVDRWASCLSDRLDTCQSGFRGAVDFQLKLTVFAS